MPELPEVNTLSAALNHHLCGDSFAAWQSHSTHLRKPIPDFKAAKTILNKPVQRVFRQAKSIFFDFGSKLFLHVHLGMTGYFELFGNKNASALNKHEHLRLELSSGRVLSYFDPRKFGLIELLTVLPLSAPEPFNASFALDYLQLVCSKSRRQIKTLIMDQKVVSGIGNIYANEALHLARIAPERISSQISNEELKRLRESIILVIGKAVASGLRSLEPEYRVNSTTTHFPIETNVYGRLGEYCATCKKTQILRVIVGGRSSFFCPICQK